jgi:hypothetical protein
LVSWTAFLPTIYALSTSTKSKSLKALYTMSVKKQMEKKWWLKYSGSFFSRSRQLGLFSESLDYAASLLNVPGTYFALLPAGRTGVKSYIRHIDFKDGVSRNRHPNNRQLPAHLVQRINRIF